MEWLKRIIEWTIVGLMDFFFVLCHLRTLAPATLHVT